MKNLFNSLIIIFLAGLTSCSQYNFNQPDTSTKGQRIESTTTIQYLENTYMVTDYTDKGYYTADRISSATPLVFNGIVTSNDLMGNQYKYIVVQEDNVLTANPRAIRISIDANNVSNFYPTGQRVSVIANDWCIGKYGNCPQMGIYSERPSDGRISPGAMPLNIVRQTIIAYDIADIASVIPKEMTIAQIKAYKTHHMDIDWQLVKINNVHFTGYGEINFSRTQLTAESYFFGLPKPNVTGAPILREISDKTDSLYIATSEFANFASTPLPSTNVNGDVVCVVSWYQGRATDAGSFQVTLRSLHDLGIGFK
ncbi:MAG: DUF5689 domain-containing protein [Paludibacter sp.]|nr:DUF5689 domain-containing protein [Paludibacter sp.]